jgi:uncharacterized membrane protein YdbT with pleckstrin-like domain
LTQTKADVTRTSEPVLVVTPSTKLIKPFYALAALLVIVDYVYNSDRTPRQDWLLIFPAIIFLWALVRHLKLRFTRLSLRGDKLRYETGILSRSTRTMEVHKVQDVRVDQKLSQRLIGTGDISIETAGETSRLTMKSVDRPHGVADRLLEAARH